MASQDNVCSHEKPNEGHSLELAKCGNKRPISTQQHKQSPLKPPVAAKPKRKPPSPPTKPAKPPPRPAPSRQSSHVSLVSSTSSTSIDQSNDKCYNEQDQHENHILSNDSEEGSSSELSEKNPLDNKSTQPPPLPSSPPSKARLHRSSSGSKASQNKEMAPTSPTSPSPTPVTSLSLSSSSSTTSLLSPSSSLNLISESSNSLPKGKSPPPLRPKPVPSIKPFLSQSSTDLSTSPNPPPRKAGKDKRTEVSLSKSDNPDCSLSDLNSPNPSPSIPKRKPAPPPPVPRKSPKPVPKSSSPDKKHSSPPPRPMSPPTKAHSPDPPSNPPISQSVNLEPAFSQTPDAQPLTPDLSQSQSPTPNPVSSDVVDNPDIVDNPSNGVEPTEKIPSTNESEPKTDVTEPEKKKVPPPLPKNPPRGTPLRKSKSVTASPQHPPPPPPPPRASPHPPCLRSKSLQVDSLLSGVDNQDPVPSGNSNTSEEKDSTLDSSVAPEKTTNSLEKIRGDLATDKPEGELRLQNVDKYGDGTKDVCPVKEEVKSETPPEAEDKTKDSVVRRVRAPPRPVPRKRSSINSVEVPKELQPVVPPQPDQVPKTGNFVEPELEYSEVYTGHSEENSVSGSCASLSGQEQNLSEKASGDSTLTLQSSISEQRTVSDISTDDPPQSPIGSSDKDDFSLPTHEPEATCDMLKEIEELLKNKLGSLDEPILTSLPDEDVSLRICDNNRKDDEEEPVRPPRPKRNASFRKGSLESLNSIDKSSDECLPSSSPELGSDKGSKSAPQKPKRTTLPRVGRSRSDVTSAKSLFEGFDDNSLSSPTLNLPAEEFKPVLPPRIESLRKAGGGYATVSQQESTPPPLPPRNKPRSASMNTGEFVGRDRSMDASPSKDPPPKPFLSPATATSKDGKSRSQSLSPNINDMSAFTKGALPASASQGQNKPAPRPVRKAPPPPRQPKRNATFGPGDEKSPENTPGSGKQDDDRPMEKSSRETTPKTTKSGAKVKKSKSLFSKWKSKKEEDCEYHDISDPKLHEKTPVVNSVSTQEGSPKPDNTDIRQTKSPPRLPPRPKVMLGSPKQSPKITHDQHREESSVSANDDTSDAPNTDVSGSSTDLEQSTKDKRAHAALLEKVSQDFGFSKSNPETSSENEMGEKGDESTLELTDVNESEKTDKDNEVFGNETFSGRNRTEDTLSPLSPQGRGRCVSTVSNYSTASEQEDEEDGPPIEDVSSHSDTDPEDAEAIYAERKAKKVFNIAQEIASSERTFVDVLMLLNVDFRLHISKETERQGQPIIPSETLNKILDFLPQLQNFNEDLLKDLEHRVEKWEDNPCISDIFVKKGPFLKLYSSYIRNFENSTAILDDSCKKNQAFANAVKDFEMGPRCAKLALKHFMLKPIQRIPQYKLLLQEYQKNLHPHSQDFKNTMTALNIVTEVADHANESMRHGDNVQKLLEIQRSLIGQFEVIQPGREFIKQGELQKVSRKVMQPRMFFLFSDVLLYTTPATSGFKLNNILPLSGMKVVVPKNEVYQFEFNIISVQRSFTLCASSSQEKEEWLVALHKALDDNLKRFNTFESQRSAPQTSLIDKDFVLGHKAPLWVPDARVTMCMLCLSEFTITWRRHHCRSCGRIICHQCSNNKAPLRYLQYKPARVCNQCYEKLHEVMKDEYQNSDKKARRKSSFRGNTNSTPSSPTSPVSDSKDDSVDKGNADSALSVSGLLSRFHRIRKSGMGGDRKNYRPSVLKEVHANDEGSDMSGYLRILKNRKWKRLWFVVKGKVLYTYKASEDMAAVESMPLLGYEVTRMTTWYEGAEPDLSFELSHQNTQSLVSMSSGDPLSPRQMPDLEKTKQRLIFRTDSAAAVTNFSAKCSVGTDSVSQMIQVTNLQTQNPYQGNEVHN